MLVLRLGWRNLWRNTRRSVINIAAIAAAFVFLILMLGMFEGLRRQMLENGTGLMLGHLQIHHMNFLPDRSIYETLGGVDGIDRQSLRNALIEEPEIEAVSERVYGFALLSTGEHSAGAMLMGVDPEEESRVTSFLYGALAGDQFPQSGTHCLWLGDSLAQELQASIGSEVAAVTQAADGSMGNELFRVTGILRTGLSYIDRSLAVLYLDDLQELLVLEPKRLHEIAVRLTDPLQAENVTAELNGGTILPEGTQAKSWGDLSPQLREFFNLTSSAYAILIGLVGIFAAMGILNTMMMAVFERTREIGMVSSLGMAPSQIFISILAESSFLAILGLGAGLLISAALMQYLTVYGVDLSLWTGELSMLNTRMDPVIRFEWIWRHVGLSAIGLLSAALLAAAIPARKAVKLNPIQALAARMEV